MHDCWSWPREEKFWSDDCRSWPREENINNHGCWGKHAHIPENDYWGICLFHVVWTNFFLAIFLMWYTRNINSFFFINWTLRMSDNLPERVQILGHTHILCITVRENRIFCSQIFCDFLLKSAFERIFNVMQLILVKIKWHINKWKYLIQKFHDIFLSYYYTVRYYNICISTHTNWTFYIKWGVRFRYQMSFILSFSIYLFYKKKMNYRVNWL
jgi:hypothetical protein